MFKEVKSGKYKETFKIQPKAWANLIIEEKLGDGSKIYFERMSVSKVPVYGIDVTESHIGYCGYWLDMGKKYDSLLESHTERKSYMS